MNEIVNIHDTGMGAVLTPANMRAQVNLIQQIMKEVMFEGQHYGRIPGCGDKPTLLKPGAEKLSVAFKLRPIMKDDADIKIVELGNGHREVIVRCHIINAQGEEVATGVGSCSTMEKKYRYRNVADYEDTGLAIPKDSKEKKAFYRKQGYGMRKINEEWAWVQFNDAAPVENPDIADTYNTVLKMGKKRAYIDGMLSATGASDFFTQDIEDMPAEAFGGSKDAQEATVVDKTPKPAKDAPKAKDNPASQVRRASEQEPTPAELKAFDEKKKAELAKLAAANKAPEQAPKVAPAILGVIVKQFLPKAGADYQGVIYQMKGYEDKSLESDNPAIIAKMSEYGKSGVTVSLTFAEVQVGEDMFYPIQDVRPATDAEVGPAY